VEQARKLLERIGFPGQRLQMINLSSAMAGQFAFAVAEFAAEIQRLGPSPVRSLQTARGGAASPDAGRDGPLRPSALPSGVIEQEQAAEG
jgi:hypothetical protein